MSSVKDQAGQSGQTYDRAAEGQPLVSAFFRHVVESRQLAHTYVFAGPRGMGKREAARDLAMVLNCNQPNVTTGFPRGCGTCLSCRKVEAGNHPDLEMIEPGGSRLKLDQVKHLTQRFAFRPREGGYQIVILAETDQLTREAANSLLKVLEDPPADSILILLCQNEARLLPTIRSRSQIIRFQPVAVEWIKQWLLRQTDVSEEEALMFARLGQGNPGRARELATSDQLAKRRQFALSVIQFLVQQDEARLFELASGLNQRGDDVIEDLDLIATYCRDLIVHQAAGVEQSWFHRDQRELLSAYLDTVTPQQLTAAVSAIEDAKWQIDRHGNRQLVLEVMLYHLIGGTTSQWMK